jgi:hypothetical protein
MTLLHITFGSNHVVALLLENYGACMSRREWDGVMAPWTHIFSRMIWMKILNFSVVKLPSNLLFIKRNESYFKRDY